MNNHAARAHLGQTLAEIVLIFAVFFLHGAYPVPDSNEAHYLTKARHYWDQDFAAGDFFLESADAHQMFYWTFGWLTLWLTLAQSAWVGRVLTWILLAWGWQRLSFAGVPRRWISVLTAAVFVGLNENAHMAGEWVVGGIEAKGFAYALVFFAIAHLMRGQWALGSLLLGAATAFHVLVGGWAMIATGVAWLAVADQRPPLRSILPAAVVAVVLALPGVYFGLALSGSVDTETIREANRIYVFERLPHHLSSLQLASGFLMRHLLLQAAWLLLITFLPAPAVGHRILRSFVGTTIAVCWIGVAFNLLLQHRPEWLAAVMRYYWFRASDVFVPVGVSIELAGLIAGASGVAARLYAARGWLAGALVMVAIDSMNQVDHLPFVVPGIHDEPATPRADKNVEYEDWIDVCSWIVENTQPGDIVLTPRMAATFTWYTGRPEVATWKNVPQDARSIVEWWGRIHELHATGETAPRWFSTFAELGPERLHALLEKYDASYVVVPLDDDVEPLPIDPLYANESYSIYRREQLDK